MTKMKYAKKMKLVDIDEATSHQSHDSHHTLQSDTNFVAPRTLSLLDRAMNDILNRCDIPDNEKWMIYNQTLQKFLSYMRNKRTQDTIQNSPSTRHKSIQSEQRNHTQNTFDRHISNFSLNDIFPVTDARDSIDLISPPIVREFFEQARVKTIENEVDDMANISGVSRLSSELSSPATPPSYMDFEAQQTPQRIPVSQRRASKRNADQNITNLTGAPPRKITQKNREAAPKSLYRQRQPTQSNNDFYWQATKAK